MGGKMEPCKQMMHFIRSGAGRGRSWSSISRLTKTLSWVFCHWSRNKQSRWIGCGKKIWPFKSFFSSKWAHECTWNTKVMNIMPWKGIRPWFPVLDGWWCHGGEMERQCCHLNRSVLFFYFFKAKIEGNSPAPSVWGRQRLIRAFIRAVKAIGGCEAFMTLNLSGRRDD